MSEPVTIYHSWNAELLATGLQPSSICDAAIQMARLLAEQLNADVCVYDPTHIAADKLGRYTTHPDGSVTSGWEGDWPEERDRKYPHG